MTDPVRQYAAILIAFGVACAVCAIAVAVLRLVQPDAALVRRGRLPGWWRGLTAWARSRSLRLWCPDPPTAAVVAGHLATEGGRRLSRLGVSIAEGPWSADVIVVQRGDEAHLETARDRAAQPVASIVLTDAGDAEEFRDAVVALAAALRWPANPDAA